MYFPYLRGKQFELIGLRELSARIGREAVIHPVIEPVRKSYSTIRLTLEKFVKDQVNFTLIINPIVGELASQHKEIIALINQVVPDYDKLHIGILVHPRMSFSNLERLISDISEHEYRYTLIYLGRCPDMEKLKNFVVDKKITYNLFRDTNVIRRYRRVIDKNTKVVLTDAFNSQSKNADYKHVPDEFFSDEHKFYKEDGFVGFADYVTIGEGYLDSGFAPYAVAIHLTYKKNNDEIWIKHFVSDSNEDFTDVQGTYWEALLKLIHFVDEHEIHTKACEEFKEHYNQSRYPGLGSAKKLSIKHHIELISSILAS